MKKRGNSLDMRRRGIAIALAVSACVAIPTAGFALGDMAQGSLVNVTAAGRFGSFTPASVDERLARFVAEHSSGSAPMMRFTPAGVAERGNRSVTVAVRIDQRAARSISARAGGVAAKDQIAADTGLGIAPTRYNLGISRNFQSFAKPAAPERPLALSRQLSDAAMPDLSEFRPSPGAREEPSRFAPRIALEDRDRVAGRGQRTIDDGGQQIVDLGGSYRLTRNLDVTAGVRYSQERDRIVPITEPAKQETQAVYIGTEFRF
ncbi:hypothetical protein ACFOWT_01235 [Croceibacterium xixiisoli]